jgi:hypothetical protein
LVIYIYIPHYHWVYWVFIYIPHYHWLYIPLLFFPKNSAFPAFDNVLRRTSFPKPPKTGSRPCRLCLDNAKTWGRCKDHMDNAGWEPSKHGGLAWSAGGFIQPAWDPQARTDSVPYHTCDVYFLGISSSVEGSSFLSSGASLGHPKLTWKSHYPPLCHQLHAWKIPHLQIVPANESSIFVRDFPRLMTPECIWFRWGSSDISWLVVKKPSWNIWVRQWEGLSIHIMENKIHVPNHQPVRILINLKMAISIWPESPVTIIWPASPSQSD